MKKILLLAGLALAGWYVYGRLQRAASPEAIRSSAPVRYTEGLKADVEKARQAKETANQRIQQGAAEVKKVLDGTEQQ